MKKKQQKEHSTPGLDADSLWSRLSNKKSMKGGKSIQQMLGIEDKGPEPMGGEPMKMMDVVMSMYEKEGEEDDQED